MREVASVFSYKMWLERWRGKVLQRTQCSHQSRKLLPCPETPFKKTQNRRDFQDSFMYGHLEIAKPLQKVPPTWLARLHLKALAFNCVYCFICAETSEVTSQLPAFPHHWL